MLSGGDGIDSLDGGSGDDQLLGGTGDDQLTVGVGPISSPAGGQRYPDRRLGQRSIQFLRGDGQDTILDSDPFPGNQDRLLLGTTINPLDLVICSPGRMTCVGDSWLDGFHHGQELVHRVRRPIRLKRSQAGNGQNLTQCPGGSTHSGDGLV